MRRVMTPSRRPLSGRRFLTLTMTKPNRPTSPRALCKSFASPRFVIRAPERGILMGMLVIVRRQL